MYSLPHPSPLFPSLLYFTHSSHNICWHLLVSSWLKSLPFHCRCRSCLSSHTWTYSAERFAIHSPPPIPHSITYVAPTGMYDASANSWFRIQLVLNNAYTVCTVRYCVRDAVRASYHRNLYLLICCFYVLIGQNFCAILNYNSGKRTKNRKKTNNRDERADEQIQSNNDSTIQLSTLNKTDTTSTSLKHSELRG